MADDMTGRENSNEPTAQLKTLTIALGKLPVVLAAWWPRNRGAGLDDEGEEKGRLRR